MSTRKRGRAGVADRERIRRRDNGKRTKTRIGADGMPIGDHHWNT